MLLSAQLQFVMVRSAESSTSSQAAFALPGIHVVRERNAQVMGLLLPVGKSCAQDFPTNLEPDGTFWHVLYGFSMWWCFDSWGG